MKFQMKLRIRSYLPKKILSKNLHFLFSENTIVKKEVYSQYDVQLTVALVAVDSSMHIKISGTNVT